MTPAGLTVLLAVEPVDMRRSFDGLALWVQEKLGQEPRASNAMFVFINRRRDMIKALWLDATGWCLLAKRLDDREVVLPREIPVGASSIHIDSRALVALLDGVARPSRETGRDVARASRAAAQTVRPQLIVKQNIDTIKQNIDTFATT
jgi:transposase